ncbi:hypothetical protein EMEDMD4_150148 [Sinorhizobium medicae]|uniref:Uncharacterized protein n=1 Tax=Sinorhizobium medicae TaxID=110321 RepID=A0A508WUA5_9HYPH|nr:hypothetical protein EMEDMD4_150148 [Sinorhizobium medicae]
MRHSQGKKEGHKKNLGPYSCEGNLNLQRGTAAAVALGGEATKMHQLSSVCCFFGLPAII